MIKKFKISNKNMCEIFGLPYDGIEFWEWEEEWNPDPNYSGCDNPFYGCQHTEEWKKEQSERKKLLWQNPVYKEKNRCKGNSPETRKKIGAAAKGRTHTNETKKKISEKNKLYDTSTWTSKFYKIEDPKGNIFEICNLSKFCRDNNLKSEGMRDVSRGKQKNYKGWKCQRIQNI